jgi:hypothetical protein
MYHTLSLNLYTCNASYVCMHARMYVCSYVCTYVRMYVRTYVFVCMYVCLSPYVCSDDELTFLPYYAWLVAAQSKNETTAASGIPAALTSIDRTFSYVSRLRSDLWYVCWHTLLASRALYWRCLAGALATPVLPCLFSHTVQNQRASNILECFTIVVALKPSSRK